MNMKADFLIPDYQRSYAWDESECQILWGKADSARKQ